MFKKTPHIKSIAPLKSSERRRIADQLITDLGIEPPPERDDTTEEKAELIANRTIARNALLPENASSARFSTATGSGQIFIGSGDDQEQRILWARIGDVMYPSVYTLWKNPGIVPLLHTHPHVVEKIQGGADLMIPGLANGPPFPQNAKKGSLVAVASTESPTVPIAVGTCEVAVCSLEVIQGVKGHAVNIIHWYGDSLWNWSTSNKPGKEQPETLKGWAEIQEPAKTMARRTSELAMNDGQEDSAFCGGTKLPSNEDKLTNENDLIETVTDQQMTTDEIDEAFRKAFLYGVRHYMEQNKNQPNYGLEFPLSQSVVMATLVQPFLPVYTSAQRTSLQIKRSSWKNIKRFMKYLDKQQIVKTKDRDGNEVVILDIDFNDQAIQNFVLYSLPRKDTSGTQKRSEKDLPNVEGGDVAIGQKLKRIELYKPKEKLGILFNPDADAQGYYTATEIRAIVSTYVEKEELISPTNKRLVKVNSVLANTIFDGTETFDKEVLNKGSVPRDALVDRILRTCNPFYTVLRNDESTKAVKPKAGVPPKVKITLETRSGNKTVTKVSGLEAYFISPQPLADELRKTCAGSTSVEQLKGSSPKIPVMEIMIQGPQKEAVAKALEKRGVNRQWLEMVDKTKGKKK